MMPALRKLLLGLVIGAITLQADAATFSVVNLDVAGSGLNDTTSFAPMGGNAATTLGQARLNVLQEAGRVWGQRLASTQPIVMEVKFEAQTCTSNSATLASAGPKTFFTLSSQPGILLPAALADATNGQNNNNQNDLSITINSNIGSGSSCLGGRSFYLGLDHNNGSNIDLLNVLLHELGHGLGFISLTDSNGAPVVAGKFSAFDQFIYAESLGKFWPAMSDAERAAASTSVSALVFNGAAVNGQLSSFSTNTGLSNPGGRLRLYAPATYSDGSSVSHWDTVAFPDLLMEPFIRANPSGLVDLTGCVLRDIGWNTARCPDSGINNTRPAAQSQNANTSEDIPVQLTLMATDTDGSGPLIYRIVSNPAHGSLVLPNSMSSSTGVAITYLPAANYNGSDSFAFQVSDGIDLSVPATVTLSIAAVNDAPTAVAQTVNATANTAVNITLSGNDPEGALLTYSVIAAPAHGSLSGTAPNLVYTPDKDFTGTDSVAFACNDGALGSSVATVAINIIPAANTSAGASSSASGGGGGGAWQWPALLMLALVAVWRRKLDSAS